MALRYAKRFDGVTGSAIRDIFKLLKNPEIISFAGGNPANSALEADVISQLAQEVLAQNGVQLLQYGQTEGYAPLRESAAEFARRRNAQRRIEGSRLAKACSTMQARYGARFEFCSPDEAARRIVEILMEEGRRHGQP